MQNNNPLNGNPSNTPYADYYSQFFPEDALPIFGEPMQMPTPPARPAPVAQTPPPVPPPTTPAPTKKQAMLITFKLKDDTQTETFLAASDKLQTTYLAGCKGFLGRHLMVHNGAWADWVIWETMADAENAMKHSGTHPAGLAFNACIGEVLEFGLHPLERVY